MILLLTACSAALVLAVGAAAPQDVVSDLVARGYAIESGADATDAVVGRAVSDARSFGSLFYAVVLADEPAAGATTFADGVLDRVPRSEGTVLVVAPETVGWSSNADIWSTDELNRALDASLDGSTSNDVVTIFVEGLVAPSSGGGGLWIFLLVIVVIVAVVAFLVWRGSRNRRRTRERAVADLKVAAQTQIDAIANDILDDEAEVAESSDEEVKQHFDAAGVIYRDAADRVASATTAQEMVGIASDLDIAIWHLDCTEALLDGKEPPPRPEPPTARPTAAPSTTARADAPASSGLPSLPTYDRRPTRRSGFGADDVLKTVLAVQAMRSIGGGFRGGGSSRSRGRASGSSTRRSSSSSGRSRGGGRRRG